LLAKRENVTVQLWPCGHDAVIDTRHVTPYYRSVIKTSAHRRTRELFLTGKAARFSADVARRAARKLEFVDLATTLCDLKVPAGNHLHALHDDRQGQHPVAGSDQWRISFRFVDGDACDVEVCNYR